jgi:hypothetical protein
MQSHILILISLSIPAEFSSTPYCRGMESHHVDLGGSRFGSKMIIHPLSIRSISSSAADCLQLPANRSNGSNKFVWAPVDQVQLDPLLPSFSSINCWHLIVAS